MRMFPRLLVFLSVSCLMACAGVKPQPPEVQLAGLELSELSLSHANFVAEMKLYNPNAYGLDVKGMHFELFLNELRIASGQTAQAFHLPAEDFGSAALHLSSSLLNLLQLTGSLEGKSEISFRIRGGVKVGGLGVLSMNIPIDHAGKLPLTGSLRRLKPERTAPF